MKILFKPGLVIILLLSAAMCFTSVVSADDKWCWLEATMERTHVSVTDVDVDGSNPKIWEKILWEGWIEQGERQKIVSTQGQINYAYRLASDDLTAGGNSSYCDTGNTISIP